jgi:hypothetical protein
MPSDGPEREIAMWRMEIGNEALPGCAFHAQILGEAEGGHFPRTLSVPRLPLFMATPLAALDFFLGELFQNDWPEVAARASANTDMWRGIHAPRWERTLDWQKTQIAGAVGSPWLAVKRTYPQRDLFLSGA